MKRSLFLFVFGFSVLCANESDYEFRGQHFVASYNECDANSLENITSLKEAFLSAILQSGATVLGSIDYVFQPSGFTMVVLLSESHASIHTYPEHKACFVDLFTCGTKCNTDSFHQTLSQYFKTTSVSHQTILRDKDMSFEVR